MGEKLNSMIMIKTNDVNNYDKVHIEALKQLVKQGDLKNICQQVTLPRAEGNIWEEPLRE